MTFEKQINLPREDQPSWYRAVTWPAEKVYSKLTELRNERFARGLVEAEKLDQLVISVGNITVGGTGKTPVVISLCAHLKSLGKTVGILTRGYGTSIPSPGWMAVKNEEIIFGSGAVPDEAAMESAALRDVVVVAGPERAKAAKEFVAKFPDDVPEVWVLDDGFQHQQLHRNVNILCVDDETRFGNQHLLPAGPLRESLQEIRRADVVLYTRSQASGRAAPYRAGNLERPAYSLAFDYEEFIPIYSMLGLVPRESREPSRWLAVCGIASPERFTNQIRTSGKEVVDTLYFRDHQAVSESEMEERIRNYRDEQDVGIVTTAKDLYRNKQVFEDCGLPVYVLPMAVEAGKDLWNDILSPFKI